ncbi:MAG: hypothetical protein F8N38_06215 [Hungatella sp.]|nr:hypothetical protein [Hungatella sp.]
MKAKCELEPVLNKCPHFDPVKKNVTQIIAVADFTECPAQKVSLSILGSHDGMSNTIKNDNARRVRNTGYPPLI